MTNTKIEELIARKNRNLEDQACATAEELINKITETQAAIVEGNAQIFEWQKELRALEIPVLNPKSIIGE